MAAFGDIYKGKSNVYDGESIKSERPAMPAKIDWTEKVKGMLKAELKRRNLTYSDLVEKLSKIGIEDTEVNIRNKIARGGFTAVFFVQCLEAVGVKELRF